jgi:hypothetical protein
MQLNGAAPILGFHLWFIRLFNTLFTERTACAAKRNRTSFFRAVLTHHRRTTASKHAKPCFRRMQVMSVRRAKTQGGNKPC